MKVAYFVRIFPTLSQAFLQREILGLIENGIEIEVFPCQLIPVRRTSRRYSFVVHYPHWGEFLKLPVNLVREAFRSRKLLLAGLRTLLANPPSTLEAWYMTVTGLLTAARCASLIRAGNYDLLHAAWANAPATAAAALKQLTNVPFSFAGHARDIYWVGGDPFLSEKLQAARFVHTSVHANVSYLRARVDQDIHVVFARRGLEKLPPVVPKRLEIDTLRLLSVGRLVEKKGHCHQIEACRVLRERGWSFKLKIVGAGRLRPKLEAMVKRLGLSNHIELCGAFEAEAVEALYQWADVFIHSGVIEVNGDRDGLPNVVPEAFAHGLAVVSSDTPGVTEAVIDEITGLTVDVTSAEKFASAIERLVTDRELRLRLGKAGRDWAASNFCVATNTAVLANAMRSATGSRNDQTQRRE